MLKYTNDPITEVSSLEYGHPSVPDEARVLFSYSPYHNVREGTAYPATFVGSGTDDMFIQLWHARKLVARLQQSSSISTAPILLQVWEGGQHGTALYGSPDATAEWLGFLMDALGMSPTAHTGVHRVDRRKASPDS